MNDKNIDAILSHFDRTADQYFSKEEFADKLRCGRPLRIKYGVDVRTPLLHIGHAVNLWLMRYLQEMGHKVVFVIGDFTTRIGDPDGRLETRPMMKQEDIANNIQAFLDQAKLVLRFDEPSLIEIRRNSEWYNKLSMSEFVDLTSLITHARLLSRDTFRARIAHNREIYVHETLYPILQGYDSLVVESDLAIIGSDQMFNESMGRLLQEKHGKEPQTIVTTNITPGIDGRGKQSKSEGNYIGLLHSPRDKFGRVMSIPDYLIDLYFRMYTDVPLHDIALISDVIEKDPRSAKMRLAREIVARYHGPGIAEAEEEWFEQTISKGMPPDLIPTLAVMGPRIEALDLVALARYGKSRSDTRRLIKQGGVELNGEKLKDPDQLLTVKTNDILKIGKRNWFRIEISKPIRLETENLWMEPVHMHELDVLTKYLPAWELVKYLGLQPHEAPKLAEAKARELLRELVFQKDPKSQWLWKITSRDEPEKILGVARGAAPERTPGLTRRDTREKTAGKTAALRRDAPELIPAGQRLGRAAMRESAQNIWLIPECAEDEEILREALAAVSDYTFFMLDFQGMMFKDAFAYATEPKSIGMLSHIFMKVDSAYLNQDTPFGASGFTQEGWKALQDWRRSMSPGMHPNEPAPKPSQFVKKEAEPEPTPQPKPQPAVRAKPAPRVPKPPAPTPPFGGEPDEET
ncbi:MAG: tyrosine--tRNA ligase [Alphaproteobacteria bacterium]